MMDFRQLFKCISCTRDSKNEAKIDSSFSYSAVNEMSEIIFDEIGEEELNDETNSNLSGLTKTQAHDVLSQIWNEYVDWKKSTYEKELNQRMFVHSSSKKIFRWREYINDGDAPETGRSLWILLYGGDQRSDEIDLKLNEDGLIWIVPNCSTDWQQNSIDLMFERLIEYEIVVNQVNPNRIFLFGMSSSGGDGVYQIISRITDRWAAVGTINGNPHDLLPLSLRNLPFALHMSQENTNEYNRQAACTWAERLHQCSKEHFAGGYQYWLKVGNIKERKQDALNWMNKHTRNPWPIRLVWHCQSQRISNHFYWLYLPFIEQFQREQIIQIEVRYRRWILLEQMPQTITAFILYLSDQLVNLDQIISIYYQEEKENQKRIFHNRIARTRFAIQQSIEQRADPMSAASAMLHIIRDKNQPSNFLCHSPPIDQESQIDCPICSITKENL